MSDPIMSGTSPFIGKTITKVWVDDDRHCLRLRFSDGSGVRLHDDGLSCCENRYMVCDDNLDEHIGTTIQGVELRDGQTTTSEYGDLHEVQFLVVKTSAGAFTVSNHNEHNGQYSGFHVVAAEDSDE